MFKYADRVVETTQTTGLNAPFVLDGPQTGTKSFVQGIGDTNTTTYTVENGVDSERWVGTVTAGSGGSPDTISRDEFIGSSTGSPVSWPSGVKNIFVTLDPDETVTTRQPNGFPQLGSENEFTTRQRLRDGTLAVDAGGLYAIELLGDVFKVLRNTAAAGDFATADTLLEVSRTLLRWSGLDVMLAVQGGAQDNLMSVGPNGEGEDAGIAKALVALLNAVNTFTASQTIQTGANAASLLALKQSAAATVALLQGWQVVDKNGVIRSQFVVNVAADGTVNSLSANIHDDTGLNTWLNVQKAAKLLVLGTTDITYDGVSLLTPDQYFADLTFNFGTILAGTHKGFSATVTGAATTDTVSASPTILLPQGIVLKQARVPSADTVEIYLQNISQNDLAVNSVTFRTHVI